MGGYSSVPQDSVSEFRVEKSRVEATLTVSNGASVRGCFFISANSRTHAGPEGVIDVLNGDAGFFPFEVHEAGRTSAILFNRHHIIFVELDDRKEAHRDPGYDVAVERAVTMLLSNGARLRGTVRVFRPQGRDRVSDFTRTEEIFRYLETANATYLVNFRHVLELVEETSGT
jgi:hypothetical protein